ncbi:MAG: hypothetical protein IJN86_02510 [Clostridia bacterium]|nr:hypothetical protein [Clostridia bacterium]
MKKYSSQATKWLMIVSLICGVVLLTGIILAFANIGNIGVPIGVILMSGLLGVILFSCFLAEKSRFLIIGADQIIFPRGAEINGKSVFKKTVVKTSEITSVETHSFKGDRLIAEDTNFYTLNLKNGRKITVTLYHYGKEAENEIWETIKRSVV